MAPFASTHPRPRVLQCVSHLALGGAERVAVTLIESLKDEFDFSVYAVRGLADGEVGLSLKNRLHAINVPVVAGPRIPMRFGGMLTGAVGLARCVHDFKPDLIHLHTEIPEASYATMITALPGLRKIPLVRTIHNAVIWKSWPALGHFCDRKMSRSIIAGVSNDAVKAFLALRASSGARPPATPTTTIYNGVNADAIARTAKISPDRTMRMIYAGRFEPEKGADLLPEILARTQLPDGRRGHLTVIGSGRHELALRWLERNPPPRWTVDVRPPAADLSSELSAADLVLLPSRHEGLSLVAIEAMLAGIQIVATDAMGLREALPPTHPWRAQADDAASFAAALQYACANHARWPAIAHAQRAFALDRFDPLKMTAGYRTLYSRALSLPGSSASLTSVQP